MGTSLDRRHGGRITALGLEIVAEETWTTERAHGAVYASASLVRLLLEDGQEWVGCTRCSAVAPEPQQIVAHQRAHALPQSARRRKARRVTTTSTSTRTVEEAQEVVEVSQAGPAATLPGEGALAERRARLAPRALPEPPAPEEVSAAPRGVAEIAVELERAEAWARALRAELEAALASRNY